MADKAVAAAAAAWCPPTPQSVLVPVPAPSLPLAPPFEPLPPPRQEPSPDSSNEEGHVQPYYHRPRSESLAYLLNPTAGEGDSAERGRIARATPTSINSGLGEAELTAPVLGYFNELQGAFQSGVVQQESRETSIPSVPSIEDDEEEDPSYTGDDSSLRKRPRREAASTSSTGIPRQPSPFELSPPPPQPSTGTGSQTNRKVSHSLIERRRRERINDCLGHLKLLVPQCREEGERKVARAKERGRKRGRKEEEDGGDQKGGLHKLEILQGTIRYVEQLEHRIARLEAQLQGRPPSMAAPSQHIAEPPSAPQTSSDHSSNSSCSTAPLFSPESLTSTSIDKLAPLPLRPFDASETATAELLLNLSTSPELRPIIFD